VGDRQRHRVPGQRLLLLYDGRGRVRVLAAPIASRRTLRARRIPRPMGDLGWVRGLVTRLGRPAETIWLVTLGLALVAPLVATVLPRLARLLALVLAPIAFALALAATVQQQTMVALGLITFATTSGVVVFAAWGSLDGAGSTPGATGVGDWPLDRVGGVGGVAVSGSASGVLPGTVDGVSSPALDCSSWPARPLPGPVSSGAGLPGPGASSLVTSRPAITRTMPAAAMTIRKIRRPCEDHPSVTSGRGAAPR